MDTNKNTMKILKTILAIIVGVIGLVTFIFAILRLADVQDSDPSGALRIVGGVALTAVGAVFLVLCLLKHNEKEIMNYRDLLISALFLGFGIFCFMPESGGVIHDVVMIVIPLIFMCFGVGLFIKSIINLVKKLPTKKVLPILLSSLLFIVIGIIFVIFHENEKLEAVVWMVVGLAMLAISIINVVYILKGNKEAKEHKPIDVKPTEKKDN